MKTFNRCALTIATMVLVAFGSKESKAGLIVTSSSSSESRQASAFFDDVYTESSSGLNGYSDQFTPLTRHISRNDGSVAGLEFGIASAVSVELAGAEYGTEASSRSRAMHESIFHAEEDSIYKLAFSEEEFFVAYNPNLSLESPHWRFSVGYSLRLEDTITGEVFSRSFAYNDYSYNVDFENVFTYESTFPDEFSLMAGRSYLWRFETFTDATVLRFGEGYEFGYAFARISINGGLELVSVSAVPEPSSLAMIGAGLIGMALPYARRRLMARWSATASREVCGKG